MAAMLIAPAAHARAQERTAEETAAIAAIKKLGGRITLEDATPDTSVVEVNLVGEQFDDEVLAELELSLRDLPKLGTLGIVSSRVTDAGIEHLAELMALTHLRLNAHVTGKGLESLEGMMSLRELEFICSGELTDEGLACLKQFSNLRLLRLVGAPHVTDATINNLRDLKGLEELHIRYTGVTDVGLVSLTGFKSLRKLYLTPALNSQFSVPTLRALQDALPDCEIHF